MVDCTISEGQCSGNNLFSNFVAFNCFTVVLSLYCSYIWSKLYDFPVGFVTPIPFNLSQCLPLFAVVERWLLLDIG